MQHDRDIFEKVIELDRSLAVFDERTKGNAAAIAEIRSELEEETGRILVAYKGEISDLKTEIAAMKKELDSVYTTIQRWRGGLVSLVALGSLTGWILTQWQAIRSLLGKG